MFAPNTFYNDTFNQLLFSGGIYSLKLQSGDLRLYSNFGLGEKLYWSLHQTLYKGDLSKVAYAGILNAYKTALILSPSKVSQCG